MLISSRKYSNKLININSHGQTHDALSLATIIDLSEREKESYVFN